MNKKLLTVLALLLGVCAGAWADAVTIGLTQTNDNTPVTISSTDYNGTLAAANYSGTTNVTVAEAHGTGCGVNQSARATYKSGAAYYATKAFRKTINSSTWDATEWIGYTIVVAEGYTMSLTNVKATMWDCSNTSFTWRVLITDNDGKALYTSGSKTTTQASSGTLSVASPTGVSDLSAGTYYVKLQMYQNGGNKYFTVPYLTVDATVTADNTPSYTMTAAVDNEAHGTAEASAASVLEGGSVNFTAASKKGYKFVNWTNTSTSAVVSTDNPYTIASVTEAVSLKANFTNAYSISYNVTDGSRGTTTTGLGTEYANDADKFTAPQNFYIFKDGYTLTSWTDGTKNYTPGTEYTIANNITLQPVFTANTKTLADRTAATTVTWNFDYIGGKAPAISIENSTGYYIKQATIDGVSTDIVMAINNTKGSAIADVTGKTVNNYDASSNPDRHYAQMRRGSKLTIPAVKGMTIVAYSAGGNYLAADAGENYATRVAGDLASSGTGTQTATWVYNGEDATIDYVAGNDANYVSKIVVTYPSPYSVTYDGNGAESGTVTDASTYDKNASVTTKANSFVKTGYAFTGWNTEADGTGTAVAAGSTFSITDNTTLYAQWIEGDGETITYVLKTSAAASVTASTHLTNLVNETSVGIAAVADQTKDDRSGKYATSSTEGYGVNFSFDIADGYTFRPTSISMQLATVSTTDFTFYVTLTDSKGTKLTSNALNSFSKDGVLTDVTFPAYDKTFAAGTVNMLVTAVRKDDAAGTYRIGKTITISGVVNEGVSANITSFGYASFSSTSALDFTSIDNAEAYIATAKNGNSITMQKVTGKIAANTGLILKSTNGGATTMTIPVATGDVSYYNTQTTPKNYLFAINSDYNLTAASNGETNYVLSVQNINEVATVVWAPIGETAAPVKAGQAGLWLPADLASQARSLRMVFDEETTGINDATLQMNNEESVKNGEVYNLNGQLVATPSNGIYIVNGKKVIIK